MNKEKIKKYCKQIKENVFSRKWLILLFLLFIIVAAIGVTDIGRVSNLYSYKFAIVFGVIFIGGTVCIAIYSNKKYLHNLVCIIVLVFGVISSFVTPILDAPDEPTHFRRSEITSRGEFFPKPLNEQGFLTIQSVVNIESECRKSFLDAEKTEIDYNKVEVTNIASSNFFLGYLPQALGILAAKIFHLPEVWMVILGRLTNVLFAASVARYAVKIVKGFKIPIMAVCCMPMALYQAASLSIDCTINYCSILAIAYFVKLYESADKSIVTRQIVVFFLLCFVAGISKITYMALSCLILLLPKKKFGNFKGYYFNFLAVFGMGIIAVLWYGYTLSLPKIINEQTGYLVQNNVNVIEQARFILNNLIQVLHMLLRKLFTNVQQIFDGFSTFGWLAYGSPWLTYLYSLFFGSILLLYPNTVVFDKKVRIGVMGICLLIFIATEIIMYLTWTSVGALNVAGVQSRYYLPILALLPMFTNFNVTIKKGKNIELYYSVCMIFFLSFMLITTLIYYYG